VFDALKTTEHYYDEFLMPSITEETRHTHHLISNVDDDSHYKIEIPNNYLKGKDSNFWHGSKISIVA
jgi:hypothetical protein